MDTFAMRRIRATVYWGLPGYVQWALASEAALSLASFAMLLMDGRSARFVTAWIFTLACCLCVCR
ncbi:MAG: hypothetical protein OXN89_20465 [Bryobacterales bacterium]|nr:hypothetical protein [Bryobacterales bacterium]